MFNKLITLASVAFLMIGFASCLKDKNVEERRYGTEGLEDKKIIEFVVDQTNYIGTGLSFVNRDTIINIAVVRLAAAQPAQEDINVTLTLASSTTMISDYNASHGSSLVNFPSSLYSVQGSGLVVTIPKGSREGYLRAKINPSTFDPSSTYALGFRIANVDKQGYTISQNFGYFIAAFGAKNKYDGIYRLRVRMRASDRPTVNTSTTWNWGGNVHLVTTGPNSVKLFDDWGFGDYIQPIQTNTFTYSGFGSTAPKFFFDLSSDKLTNVVNDFPNPPNGRAFIMDTDPNLNSKFDPATHNVYADFIMTQPNFGPLKIADTLFYVGPR